MQYFMTYFRPNPLELHHIIVLKLKPMITALKPLLVCLVLRNFVNRYLFVLAL